MRLKELKFSRGISDDMFEFLKIIVSQFQDEKNKNYSLVMDEMSIAPRKVYHSNTFFLG